MSGLGPRPRQAGRDTDALSPILFFACRDFFVLVRLAIGVRLVPSALDNLFTRIHDALVVRSLDLVREWHIPARPEATDVRAVLVLNTEDDPDPSACDFGKRDEEGQQRGVLDLLPVDGVEDPVEAEDGVDDHGGVVDPG